MLSNPARRKVSASTLATIKAAKLASHQLPSLLLFAGALAAIKAAELAGHQLPDIFAGALTTRSSASSHSTIYTAELTRHLRSKFGGSNARDFQSARVGKFECGSLTFLLRQCLDRE